MVLAKANSPETTGPASGLVDGQAWGAHDQTDSFGGASDLWGRSWTPADVNDSGFGVALYATASGDNGNGYVDYVQVTVYYTGGSGCRMT